MMTCANPEPFSTCTASVALTRPPNEPAPPTSSVPNEPDPEAVTLAKPTLSAPPRPRLDRADVGLVAPVPPAETGLAILASDTKSSIMVL